MVIHANAFARKSYFANLALSSNTNLPYHDIEPHDHIDAMANPKCFQEMTKEHAAFLQNHTWAWLPRHL